MTIFEAKVGQPEFDQFKNAIAVALAELQNAMTEERRLVEERIAVLREEVRTTSPIAEITAREAAAKAVESQTNVKRIEDLFTSALGEVNALKTNALKERADITALVTDATSHRDEITKIQIQATQLIADVTQKKDELDKAALLLEKQAAKVTAYLKESEELPECLAETKELLAEIKKNSDNVQLLLNNAVKKKTEIDSIHKAIHGEDISSSDGKITHVPGIRDELDSSYTELTANIERLAARADESLAEIRTQYEKLSQVKIEEFETLLTTSTGRFEAVDKELKGLLPGAMAAGLSAAYEEKKNDEIMALTGFNITFRNAITGLVGISAIPLLIDIYLVTWKAMDLVVVIKDTPHLLLAIMPLYFPILWLAYSANKKANLSKRLIEEYTHKSVLGKTFSGLSNQIDSLQHQGDVKEELRTKLLFNVLQVSAENPGKLITNYSKSDHPLMDALENSVKLADSVTTLAKIPGFSALANKLAAKADDILQEKTKKVQDGLSTQDVLESASKETTTTKA
jgi:hypothetical protein